jgi:two-component system sensor histidine kinase TctE
MTFMRTSLRLRLLVLILSPLIVVSIIALLWRIDAAKKTAEEIFDRNLMMLAFAISRDVTLSEGDSLSLTTLGLFRQATAGDVFYHVYGPDGSFITGYSSPPIREENYELNLNTPELFDAKHQGVPVRVVQLAELSEVDGIQGTAVVTAWQKLDLRQKFTRNLAMRAGFLAGFMILTVAALVLLGIRYSLKPLENLENAIQKRSGDDLSPIVRKVPDEIKGIVSRLNALFSEVVNTRSSRDRFISNAAHQLRNPIAGIHTMAQASANAGSLEESKARADELLVETRRTKRITEQLLSLERLDGRAPILDAVDIRELATKVGTRNASTILNMGIEFSLDLPDSPTIVNCDAFLIAEAVQNLIDNAVWHGGEDQTFIELKIKQVSDKTILSVENDGIEIPDSLSDKIFERFVQGPDSQSSGLGLAIFSEIVRSHNAKVELQTRPTTEFRIVFN